MGVAAAVGVGVGSAALGGYYSNKAAGKAADAQNASMAAQERISAEDRAFQKEMYETQQANYEPWKQAGLRGLAKYQSLLDDPSSITSNPAYQFRKQQGQDALSSSYLASGMGLSGRAGKGLAEYGQNFAMDEYQNTLNRYSTLANYGSAAVAGQSAAGSAYANNVSSNLSSLGSNIGQGYQNLGSIQAASAMAPYNSMMGGLSLATSAYGAGMFGGGSAGSVRTNYNPTNTPYMQGWTG
ncbi:hypothetical protein OAO19_02965 [Gammaproteobacteria bacterium]|nr:hypothetical protein [Gammaproteobacteria bacterium]